MDPYDGSSLFTLYLFPWETLFENPGNFSPYLSSIADKLLTIDLRNITDVLSVTVLLHPRDYFFGIPDGSSIGGKTPSDDSRNKFYNSPSLALREFFTIFFREFENLGQEFVNSPVVRLTLLGESLPDFCDLRRTPTSEGPKKFLFLSYLAKSFIDLMLGLGGG